MRFLKLNFMAFLTPVGRTRAINPLRFLCSVDIGFFFPPPHCLGFKLVAVAPVSLSSGEVVISFYPGSWGECSVVIRIAGNPKKLYLFEVQVNFQFSLVELSMIFAFLYRLVLSFIWDNLGISLELVFFVGSLVSVWSSDRWKKKSDKVLLCSLSDKMQ